MSEDQTPAPETEDLAPETGDEALDALRAENQALKDQALRYAAEADNTRRRAEREANDARAYAIQKFARDLLGVADNLARALSVPPADAGDSGVKNFVVGVEMTEKELQGAFERNGLKRILPARGEKFDPHKHQAMMEQPGSDVAAGGVIEVLQPGYELLGRLVRPAMVVVAAKGASAEPPPANPYAANDGQSAGPSGQPGGEFDRRA
jgi:molecular chaperone GrpE